MRYENGKIQIGITDGIQPNAAAWENTNVISPNTWALDRNFGECQLNHLNSIHFAFAGLGGEKYLFYPIIVQEV